MDALAGYGSSSDEDNDHEAGISHSTSKETATKPPNFASAASDELEDIVRRKRWEIEEAPKPNAASKSLIKIVLPELEGDSDPEDDSKPAPAKKARTEKKASELLSQLPPPVIGGKKKGTILSLKPRQLPKTKAPGPANAPDTVKINTKVNGNFAPNPYDSDEEDAVDYFSLDKRASDYCAIDTPIVGPSKSIDTVVADPLPEPQPAPGPSLPENLSREDVSSLPNQFVANLRSDEAMRAEFEAQGGLIDVNADAALGTNVTERLLHSAATDKFANELRVKAKSGVQASNVQRHKHQLHWLAQHAKEREVEMQLDWQKQGGGSREKARTKYGFT